MNSATIISIDHGNLGVFSFVFAVYEVQSRDIICSHSVEDLYNAMIWFN